MAKSEINQRFIEAIESLLQDKGLTKSAIAQSLGIKPAKFSEILNSRMNVGTDTLALLGELYSFNANWLLLGEGEMLKTNAVPLVSATADSNIVPFNDNIKVASRQEVRDLTIELKPRIPFNAAAGSLSIAAEGISRNECEMLPVITRFPKYDFTIMAKGDSMVPEIASGDELACRFIDPKGFIQWGRPHVLDTAQGVVVKNIFDLPDSILCRSVNNNYPDFPIAKDDIYHIALVVGLIRQY